MKTLEEQIREYGDHARQLLEPVDIDDVTIGTASAPEKRRTHPLMVVAGAATLVVLAIGLLPFLLRGQDQTPVSDSTPGSTVETPPASGVLRSQVTVGPDAELEFQDSVYRTLSREDAGVGQPQIQSRPHGSAAWDGVQGTEEITVPMAPIPGQENYRSLLGITTDGETLMAVAPWFPHNTDNGGGWARYGSCATDFEVVVSTSTNGETWETTRLTDRPFSADAMCIGIVRPTVTIGEGGMILTTALSTTLGTTPTDSEFLLIWHSNDGDNWTPVTLPDQMMHPQVDASFGAITPRETTDGFEIEIWHDAEGASTTETWESTEGITWTAVPESDESQVSFRGFEYKTNGRQLLRRTTGSDWQDIEEVDSDYPLSLTTDGQRLVAVSPDPSGLGGRKSADVRLQVFMSDDGVNWETSELADFGPMPCASLGCFIWSGGGEAVGSGGVLVVRVVTRPSFDDTYPHFWHSADGAGPWERADIPSELIGNHEIDHVGPPVAQGDGFAIQITKRYGDFDDPFDQRLETEVWESPDGRTWHKAR